MADLPGGRALVSPRSLLQVGVCRTPRHPERRLAPAALPPGPPRRGLYLQIRMQTRLLRGGRHGASHQEVSGLALACAVPPLCESQAIALGVTSGPLGHPVRVQFV